jgi:hypothetical protein
MIGKVIKAQYTASKCYPTVAKPEVLLINKLTEFLLLYLISDQIQYPKETSLYHLIFTQYMSIVYFS